MNNIIINNLSHSYDGANKALDNINLEIKLNKKTAILGANGSGKSTLLYFLNALHIAKDGYISINGEVINNKNCDKIRSQIGFLFDNPDNQLFSPTVKDDIAFGPKNQGKTSLEIEKLVEYAMLKTNIKHLSDRVPYNLSLGQKKKCAIAGVIAMQPKIILMDEPFLGLDPKSELDFLLLLDELNQEGVSHILSTHDVNLAYSWADYIIIMKEGKIIANGGVELLKNNEILKSSNLVKPLLVKIFDGTNYNALKAADANEYIKKLEISAAN